MDKREIQALWNIQYWLEKLTDKWWFIIFSSSDLRLSISHTRQDINLLIIRYENSPDVPDDK